MTAEPCRGRRGDVAAYALGRLEADDATRTLAHLDGCPTCRDALAELRSTAALLPLADPRRIDRVSGQLALTSIHPLVDRYISLLLFAAFVESYRGNPFHSTFLPLAWKTFRACRRLLGSRKGKSR